MRGSVRYCTVFSFIILLYCESYIYISPICNVETRIIFYVEIIKLGILYFSLFTDLLSETGKLGVKLYSSPMVQGVHLTKEGETFEDPERYRRLIGKLNYLTVTHPDIAYSVSVVR